MRYKNLILNIEADPFLYQYFLTLIDLIPQIPLLDQLIDEATQDGPITVDFVDRNQSITGGHFSQRWQVDHRGRISNLERFIKVVSEKSFARMLETLVFELCNAKNPYFKVNSPLNLQPRDFANREDFAYATEGAEYNYTHVPAKQLLHAMFTDKRTIQLFSKNGIHFTANELFNLRSDHFASFDDWWKHVNRVSRDCPIKHADTYRTQYDQIMGKHSLSSKPKPAVTPKTPVKPRVQPQTPVKVAAKPVVQPKTPVKVVANKPVVQPKAQPQNVVKPKPVATPAKSVPKAAAPAPVKVPPMPKKPHNTPSSAQRSQGIRQPGRTFLPAQAAHAQRAVPQNDEIVLSPVLMAQIQAEVNKQFKQLLRRC